MEHQVSLRDSSLTRLTTTRISIRYLSSDHLTACKNAKIGQRNERGLTGRMSSGGHSSALSGVLPLNSYITK